MRCIGQKFLEREAIRWKQPKNFPKSFAISLNNTGKASLSPRAFGIVLLFSYHIPSCTSPKLSSSLFQLLYPIAKEEEASISSAPPKRVLVRKCVFAAATSLSFHSFVENILLHIYRSVPCRVSSCLSSCILILFAYFIHHVFPIHASLRGKAIIRRDIEHTWTNLAVSYRRLGCSSLDSYTECLGSLCDRP